MAREVRETKKNGLKLNCSVSDLVRQKKGKTRIDGTSLFGLKIILENAGKARSGRIYADTFGQVAGSLPP